METIRLRVSGASDDLIELDSPDTSDYDDEFNAYANGKYAGWFDLLHVGVTQTAGLRVHAVYDGLWSFGLGLVPVDESDPDGEKYLLPDWPVSYHQPEGVPDYSICLEIEIPTNVHVVSSF